MGQSIGVKMTSYDQVRDIGLIAFLSKKGHTKTVSIHRKTFGRLMSGELDRSTVPGEAPSLDQIDLRDAILTEVKKDFTEWFENNANRISQEACGGRK